MHMGGVGGGLCGRCASFEAHGKRMHLLVPLTSLRLSEISFRFIDYGQALPMWFWPLHMQENVLSPRQGFCSIAVVPKALDEEKTLGKYDPQQFSPCRR